MAQGGGRRFNGGQRAGPARKRGERKSDQLGPRAREALARARRHEQAGEHAPAAEIYAKLAAHLVENGRPGVATHLQLVSAASLHRGGDADGAITAGRTAIGYGAKVSDRAKVGRKLARLVGRLRGAGLDEAADAMATEAADQLGLTKLPEPAEGGATVNRSRRRRLPKTCSTCGTSVEAKRVEFDEDGSADCMHCGMVLLG